MMFGSAGLSMLVVGTLLVCVAEKYSAMIARIEFVAGLLIVGGLSLIGVGLEWVLNPLASP
jgi:hypothetical protein